MHKYIQCVQIMWFRRTQLAWNANDYGEFVRNFMHSLVKISLVTHSTVWKHSVYVRICNLCGTVIFL